jgi:glucose repression regulatory protein TUP1
MLDVDLVHTLEHHSVVCCVRFSQDGKYVATGCNRSAQIFDVQTGMKVTQLQDESVDRDGDLYIRSVCFSPDGRYLATGAEDKQIRVSIQPKVTEEGHNYASVPQAVAICKRVCDTSNN